MQTVTANDRQSFFDITMQESGTIDQVFLVAIQNGSSLTTQLASSQQIQVPDLTLSPFAAFFAALVKKPSTADDLSLLAGGIGAMQISNTFKVS